MKISQLLPFIFSILFLQITYAQQIPYTDGNNSWNADKLGNHRAVVEFTGKGNVAKSIVEWRRRDFYPEKKAIIVVDAQSGEKVLNVRTTEINRERGVIYFEPTSGKGKYFFYYLPYIDEGPNSYYPKGKYVKPEDTADEKWLKALSAVGDVKVNSTVKEIQSINAFNSFYPMEVIATEAETALLIKENKTKSFLVFPEDRLNSIRMRHDLPQRWIIKKSQNVLTDQCNRGEFFTYQLGVYALQELKDVKVIFTDLKNDKGESISRQQMICLNTDGKNYDGSRFSNKVDVTKGKVQALWCGIDVPQSIKAGEYKGMVKVTSGKETVDIQVKLIVRDALSTNSGIDEPQRMTRLKWLNSTLAQDNSVIAPYTPLTVSDSAVSFLGRKLILGKNGLPSQIETYFTSEMTSIGSEINNILAKPMQFHFYKKDGNEIQLSNSTALKFTETSTGTVSWQSVNSSSSIRMEVNASLEFDGFVKYTVKISALDDIELRNISLDMPIQTAKYMMGLGLKGGLCPDSLHWKWDVATKNQDGAWIGNVNAGIQFSLRDEKYSRPLNTNFYLDKPLLLPTSWGNENKGGINIINKKDYSEVKAYSGSRILKKGDTLYYNFNLLITPFHPINTGFQWDARFYHKYNSIDSIKKTGAKIINIHHATPINPYINYPFIEFKKMKEYIDEAHQKGLRVKIYNTIRELSNKAYEIHALRSFGHEIFSPGKGGGFSWLQEHLGDDYIAAWFVPELKDAAIVNSGMNRWHNYYVEGMNWLTQNVGIDGIYLDDVAFDRITMKRIKRVLTQNNHPGILDLHSANQYNKRDGFNNSANLYMEHFPYLNKLWFGEYFDYEKNGPDFFLTEVSGIPFGLMGEMLQDGGNAWRGMIYGMTNRMPWSDNANPTHLWKLWDDYGIRDSEMIGYWSDNCPVKTNNPNVLVTVYKKNESVLISIASWAEEDVKIKLNINWKKIGMDPSKITLIAPEVKYFQVAQTFSISDEIPVAKGKGWLLVLK